MLGEPLARPVNGIEASRKWRTSTVIYRVGLEILGLHDAGAVSCTPAFIANEMNDLRCLSPLAAFKPLAQCTALTPELLRSRRPRHSVEVLRDAIGAHA